MSPLSYTTRISRLSGYFYKAPVKYNIRPFKITGLFEYLMSLHNNFNAPKNKRCKSSFASLRYFTFVEISIFYLAKLQIQEFFIVQPYTQVAISLFGSILKSMPVIFLILSWPSNMLVLVQFSARAFLQFGSALLCSARFGTLLGFAT